MTTPPAIRILRPGTFTDIHGTTVSFGPAELAEVVASYDAESDPAPLVVGHPKHDDPAQGWVGQLAIVNGEVVATPSDVEPAFAEVVRAKRYRKISPSLYPPKHPANPKPGKWYLKHVGFLGAMAPAIKGLGTVSFSEADDAAAVTLSFSEEQLMDIPDDQAVALAEREASLEAREAALAQREQDLADAATAAMHADHVAFAEGLVDRALLAPIGKDQVVAILDQLGSAETVLSFGEGEDLVELSAVAAFKGLFDSAVPIVALGEHAPADKAVKTDTTTVSFAAPPGFTVASDHSALHARAKALQAAEPGLQFWPAFERARAEAASG